MSKSFFSKFNMNASVALSAFVVSCCALYMSFEEVRILRIQQRATMYPYVTVHRQYSSKGFGIVVKNSGNGLAHINSQVVMLGTSYIQDWMEIGSILGIDTEEIGYHNMQINGSLKNQMIAPGEEKRLIFLSWNETSRKIEPHIEKIEVKISYSSLLDEHWITLDGQPTKVESIQPIRMDQEFNMDIIKNK